MARSARRRRRRWGAPRRRCRAVPPRAIRRRARRPSAPPATPGSMAATRSPPCSAIPSAAFGARAVVVPEHGSPSTTGVLSKAASGALEYVPLIRVTNLVRSLERLKKAGFWSVGLDETAEAPLATLDMTGRIALVLGA